MEEDYLYGGHDMGTYNLSDGSLKPIYEFSSDKIQPPPCWIIPDPAVLISSAFSFGLIQTNMESNRFVATVHSKYSTRPGFQFKQDSNPKVLTPSETEVGISMYLIKI
ncbi:hypothetical protein GQ457_16G030240 [Hibiscus cannabinus]